MLFADEFDGTELDEANWTFDIGTGNSGWGNNESQFMDRNVLVRDGVLTIRARSEDLQVGHTPRAGSSHKALIFTWAADVRAALPKGQGLPAIWMLGANFTEVGWPMSEIDIMELVETMISVHGTALE